MKRDLQFECEYVGHMGRDYIIVLDGKQPIIRCGDCTKYNDLFCRRFLYKTKPRDFCSFGERKDESR